MAEGKESASATRLRANKRTYEKDLLKEDYNKKSYVFWALVGLLCLLALANMILTVVIFSVLRIGGSMESMEFIPEAGSVKFFGLTNLGKVSKPDGKFDGFASTPVEIKGVKGPALVQVEDLKGRVRNSLVLEQNGTHFKGINSFKVSDVFRAENPVFKLQSVIRNLHAKVSAVNRISSPVNDKLILRSDTLTKLRGSEGTSIEGKEILWTADQEVRLKSMNGSIILSSKEGVSLDVKSIPVVGPGLSLSPQFKVCVCMPQGKLFKVPVSMDYNSQVACHNIDVSPSHNPCI